LDVDRPTFDQIPHDIPDMGEIRMSCGMWVRSGCHVECTQIRRPMMSMASTKHQMSFPHLGTLIGLTFDHIPHDIQSDFNFRMSSHPVTQIRHPENRRYQVPMSCNGFEMLPNLHPSDFGPTSDVPKNFGCDVERAETRHPGPGKAVTRPSNARRPQNIIIRRRGSA
jgi:hypothetical protein